MGQQSIVTLISIEVQHWTLILPHLFHQTYRQQIPQKHESKHTTKSSFTQVVIKQEKTGLHPFNTKIWNRNCTKVVCVPENWENHLLLMNNINDLLCTICCVLEVITLFHNLLLSIIIIIKSCLHHNLDKDSALILTKTLLVWNIKHLNYKVKAKMQWTSQGIQQRQDLSTI